MSESSGRDDLAGHRLPDLPGSIRLVEGPGGLPVLQVRDERHGELDVFLHGAHVTHWAPPGADPVLWLSPTSRFAEDAAIRGGVPICFPWFAAGAGDDLKPAHGYARLLHWRLESARDDGDGLDLALTLPAGSGTVTWSGPPGTGSLAAVFRIRLDASLSMTLDVRNEGHGPATFEEALHTYLAVSDVREITVEGLSGAEYVDRNGGPGRVRQVEDVIHFAGETDRIYLGSEAPVVVADGGAGRRVVVRKSGSASTVVWNPWVRKAASMSDLAAWEPFVCIETANVRSDAVTLAPGESHAMTATLEVEPGR